MNRSILSTKSNERWAWQRCPLPGRWAWAAAFHGVLDLRATACACFQPGSDRLDDEDEIIKGLNNPTLDERFSDGAATMQQEIELIRGASPEFSHEAFLAGQQTPVFFGSAINNFGVREVLDALVNLAPPPGSRMALQRQVQPDEPRFSGVVFKIQANMNPAHRDRIAFVRICSRPVRSRHES